MREERRYPALSKAMLRIFGPGDGLCLASCCGVRLRPAGVLGGDRDTSGDLRRGAHLRSMVLADGVDRSPLFAMRVLNLKSGVFLTGWGLRSAFDFFAG